MSWIRSNCATVGFALELVQFQAVPGARLASPEAEHVRATIRRLRLNGSRICRIRAEFAEARWNDEISIDSLVRHAPFVARELIRQCRTNG